MKKIVLLLMLLIIVGDQVFAQCDKCPASTAKIDYCFTAKELPGKCAQFSVKENVFYYSATSKVKKPVAIAIPEKTDLMSMLALNKANKKLNTEDVLFIQEALKQWDKEKIDIGYQTTPSGLGYKVLKEGTGPKPVPGNRVTVHYKGFLRDGNMFDSSFDRGQPVTFPIGVGQLIKGWDEGIPMFNEGSRIMLRIPPELGYGSRSTGSIPANSVLYFEIEIINAGQQ